MSPVDPSLDKNPDLQDVHALLASFNETRYPEAATLAQAMTRRFPRHPFGWKVLSAALRQLGRNTDALTCAQKVVALAPADAEAHNNLGAMLRDLGRLEEAVGCSRRALTIRPDYAEAHNNLGVALKDLGQLDEAVANYRMALNFKPDLADAHCNLGAALNTLGQLDEAVMSYRRAVELNPGLADAHSNLGIALNTLGRIDEAVASCRRALELKPDLADAHNNLGNALRDLGRFHEAVASYRRALAIKPDYAEAHSNLSTALRDLGQLDEAVTSCRRSLELKPDYAQAHNNLGCALKSLGQLDEAVASFRRAVAIQPDFAKAHSNLVIALLYHSGNKAGVIASELRRWNEQHAVPLAPFVLPHPNDRSPERRLRVGYVSPDLRDHVVGHNLLPLFERHNRRAFEIFGYAQVPEPDAMTQRFRGYCDHWCDIVPFAEARLADQIRRDQIDVLVDLALHTANNRLLLFARKPAPVQVSFAGYPGGTGVEAIDYHLTDAYLEPPGANKVHGPDAPYHLLASFWCYVGLAVDLPVGPLPAIAEGRITFGCLNNFCKINDFMLKVWARVALSVPGSRLLLLTPKGSTRERTLRFFALAGLAEDRIDFVDRGAREDYLALYNRIDVGLDTFPYNGHTTSLDSYWMGVPVVTLVGSTPVSRGGWSQLSNLGLPELAAEAPDDYVRIASQLASDLPRLAALRAGLRERMRRSPLMDGAQFARGVESAYRTMWHRWCARQDAAPSEGVPSG